MCKKYVCLVFIFNIFLIHPVSGDGFNTLVNDRQLFLKNAAKLFTAVKDTCNTWERFRDQETIKKTKKLSVLNPEYIGLHKESMYINWILNAPHLHLIRYINPSTVGDSFDGFDPNAVKLHLKVAFITNSRITSTVLAVAEIDIYNKEIGVWIISDDGGYLIEIEEEKYTTLPWQLVSRDSDYAMLADFTYTFREAYKRRLIIRALPRSEPQLFDIKDRISGQILTSA